MAHPLKLTKIKIANPLRFKNFTSPSPLVPLSGVEPTSQYQGVRIKKRSDIDGLGFSTMF
jgi:hypothetical protein